jgi:hypothetical protein
MAAHEISLMVNVEVLENLLLLVLSGYHTHFCLEITERKVIRWHTMDTFGGIC